MTAFENRTSGLSTADLAGTARPHDTRTETETFSDRAETERMADGDRGATMTDSDRVSDPAPVSPARADRPSGEHASETTPLFSTDEAQRFRTRWTDIQAGFVDEPRQAVENADGLVADVMKRLAESFAQERSTLEGQWDRGDNIDTEQLRLALRRYRSFFDRLLAV